LQAKGYHIVSPRGLGQWSGAVCFTSPAHDHQQIVRALRKEHRIEIRVPRRPAPRVAALL
jgi:hypothetical protein